ncbi:MAG TPA: hypothetical protein VFV50_18290 [Bdellovibrionales bacterium]|nr:hypothetical protein [Bdellovibrionales bacterium]
MTLKYRPFAHSFRMFFLAFMVALAAPSAFAASNCGAAASARGAGAGAAESFEVFRGLLGGQPMFFYKGTYRWYTELSRDAATGRVSVQMASSRAGDARDVETLQTWRLDPKNVEGVYRGALKEGETSYPTVSVIMKPGSHAEQVNWVKFLTERQIKYGVLPLSSKLGLAKKAGEYFGIEPINEFFDNLRGTTRRKPSDAVVFFFVDSAARDRAAEALQQLIRGG